MPKPRNLNPAYRFVATIVRPAVRAMMKREWAGHEHFPATGGFVVCPNHISYADVFAVALFTFDSGREPYFLGKDSVFRLPGAGRLLKKAGMIPVYRESGQATQAFAAAMEAVREGKSVVIYPEGTLTRDPDLWPMTGKTGAARVALETRCPVIPVAQWGAQEILARYSKKPRILPRKTTHLRAGPPVDLTDLYDQPINAAVLKEATDRIMAAITRELEVLRGEEAPPVRFDGRKQGLPKIGKYDPSQVRRTAEPAAGSTTGPATEGATEGTGSGPTEDKLKEDDQ